MANKAIQYTIYPDEKQNELCQKTFGCVRFVYNQMLSVQQDRHKAGERHLSKVDANAYCNHNLKAAYPFLKEVSFSTLFDADFGELNEKNFCLYLMVCCPYLEVKASLKRLKAWTSKYGQHEK